MLAMLMMISAEDEEGEREKEKEEGRRYEGRHAATVRSERHDRAEPADESSGERDEQEPDDGPHISNRRADARKPPPLLWRHQFGHHGVIERLSRLICVVGDH